MADPTLHEDESGVQARPPISTPPAAVLRVWGRRAGAGRAVRDPSQSVLRDGPRGFPVRFETQNSPTQPGAVISTLPPCLNL